MLHADILVFNRYDLGTGLAIISNHVDVVGGHGTWHYVSVVRSVHFQFILMTSIVSFSINAGLGEMLP